MCRNILVSLDHILVQRSKYRTWQFLHLAQAATQRKYQSYIIVNISSLNQTQTRSKLGRIEYFKFHILRILLAKSFQLFCITIKSIIWEVFSVLLTSKTKSTNQDSKVKLNGPIIYPQSSREHRTCRDVSLFYPHLECKAVKQISSFSNI